MKAKQKKKKIVSAIITIFLTVITLLCLVVVIGNLVNNDPSLFGFRCFYVISGSMEPTVHEGALVITKRSDDGNYAIDDIITFESIDPAIFGEPNTHRIADIVETSSGIKYVTKGDANPDVDSTMVSPSRVYGKVIFTTPALKFMGTFLDFLMTPYGFLILIIIPIMLVVVSSLKDYVKTYREALENIKKECQNNAANGGGPAPETDNNTDAQKDEQIPDKHQGGE